MGNPLNISGNLKSLKKYSMWLLENNVVLTKDNMITRKWKLATRMTSCHFFFKC